MPSNYIATMENKGRTSFPNLARGHKAEPEDHPDVDEQIKKEATEAGLIVTDYFSREGEVPTKLFVHGYRWSFERAWYYWRAKGLGIPPEFAVPFDKVWGKQVRVDGDCACRGAEFWGEGFAIGSYHIDTQEGLNAFVQLLASIHKSRKEKE